MITYRDCIYYQFINAPGDVCRCSSDVIIEYCETCPHFYKNQRGNTMEKLSRTILTINVRDNTINYKDVLPIIQKLAEYEASDLSPEEIKQLKQFDQIRQDTITNLMGDNSKLLSQKKHLEGEIVELNDLVERTKRQVMSQDDLLIEREAEISKLMADRDYYKTRFEGIPSNVSFDTTVEVEEDIEITPQDYIRMAVDNLFRAVEEMGENK